MKKKMYLGAAGLVAVVGSYFGIDAHSKWVEGKVRSGIEAYANEDKRKTDERFQAYEAKDRKKTAEELQASGKRIEGLLKQEFTDGLKKYEAEDKKRTAEELQASGKRIEGLLKQEFTDGLKKYEAEDKKRTAEELNAYGEKIEGLKKEIFFPKDQLNEAFNSVYLLLSESEYEKAIDGTVAVPPQGSGSAILLNGGYLLTARHNLQVSPTMHKNIIRGNFVVGYEEWNLKNRKFRIATGSAEKPKNKKELEEIIIGAKKDADYALLKVNGADLPHYSKGLNFVDDIKRNRTQGLIIGHPLGLRKNSRRGDFTQEESDSGKNYFTFDNGIAAGDSGGAGFALQNGEMRFIMLLNSRRGDTSIEMPSKIGYGLKVKSIIQDMENQLKTGKLDKNKAAEVKNFLKLNKK